MSSSGNIGVCLLFFQLLSSRRFTLEPRPLFSIGLSFHRADSGDSFLADPCYPTTRPQEISGRGSVPSAGFFTNVMFNPQGLLQWKQPKPRGGGLN